MEQPPPTKYTLTNFMEQPPPTKYTVLSFGAGVQSSCLALMAAKGEITPMPDFAVFADTQAEPKSVYEWLDFMKMILPFPIHVVTKSSLEEEAVRIMNRQKDTEKGVAGSVYVEQNIPSFGILDGKKSPLLKRQCTSKWKIKVIVKEIRRLCGIARGQTDTTVTQWIGISNDEIERLREPRDPWVQNRWPLIEKEMDRKDCLRWMRENGYPQPPRSACYFCAFRSDAEWKLLKDKEPEYFQKAIEMDERLRTVEQVFGDSGVTTYLHRSCKPLSEVDFDSEHKDQDLYDFRSECEGMCGM